MLIYCEWKMGPVRGLPKLVGDGSLHFSKTESHLHCELESLCSCKRYLSDCKYLPFCLFLTAKRLGKEIRLCPNSGQSRR